MLVALVALCVAAEANGPSEPCLPGGVVGKHQLSEIVEIPASSVNDSAMVHFRLFRSGNTDANNDAVFIHEIDIHYKRDRLGSAGEYGDK